MAVRLRWVKGNVGTITPIGGGYWVALCAAEYPAEPEDVYIDDAQDHALREKYLADYESEELLKASGQAICEAEGYAKQKPRR